MGWASGAAQAAQVVRIILRFAASYGLWRRVCELCGRVDGCVWVVVVVCVGGRCVCERRRGRVWCVWRGRGAYGVCGARVVVECSGGVYGRVCVSERFRGCVCVKRGQPGSFVAGGRGRVCRFCVS